MMLRLKVVLPFFLVFNFCCFQAVFCQISDEFSDGDFTINPSWVGNLSHFIVNASQELQLNAPGAGTSTLAVQGNIPDSALWNLSLRLQFAPSTSNLLRIYLLADQSDLLQARGYFLEIGENGSADALRLYRQDGFGMTTLLATGIPGFVANDPVDIRLRVQRTSAGDWTIEAALAASAFQPQGTAFDAVYTGSQMAYFGFHCVYTATRVDKFYFDNISIQPLIPDSSPPVLLSAQAASSTIVEVLFNEMLDSATALNPANYAIVGIGAPVSAAFVGSDRFRVRLQLQTPLATGDYILQVSTVADVLGNISTLQTAGFQYVSIELAAEFDILINEIVADPTPSVGLPEVEWLELYNRSGKTIDLKTLRLSDGGTPAALPDQLLQPDSYIVLTNTAGAALLQPFTNRVFAMSGFPSLNNDGDMLMLTNATGSLIDRVDYQSGWHENTAKRDGGWSLERINPGLPCLGAENWTSCQVLPGGTPGQANSALQTTADTEAPRLLTVFPEDPFVLRATFSEGVDRSTAANTAAYRIDPSLQILAATLAPDVRDAVFLTLAEPLQAGVVYAVTAGSTLLDCSGNSASTLDTVFVGLPELPEPQDIVINEVLFNPASGGSDFVELYNRSGKIFDLRDFFIGNFSGSTNGLYIAVPRLFLPGEYLVLTPSPTDIESRFAQAQPDYLLNLDLPTLPDDGGNVSLLWIKSGTIITVDSFDYVDDMHNALYSSSEREGVSLERIRADGLSNDLANWTSAARSASGSGTPTRPNSQRQIPFSGSDLITLNPARLSPDFDGYEDFLNIEYAVPGSGYAATITIYDSQGLPVKRLARQELIGAAGTLRWDGDLDDGTLARPGIYILFLEIFAPQGAVRQEKKPFAVVQRF